jgi:hypothetical protein
MKIRAVRGWVKPIQPIIPGRAEGTNPEPGTKLTWIPGSALRAALE